MKRSYFAPEVIQTSAMDCGPASLKTLLEGHGIEVSYGRLREACQTDVDGTSIDTLEQAAVDLGLDAAQVMAPVDDVGRLESELLPCLIVTRQPGGSTHFVVVWRRHGGYLQIMDPATGRKWVRTEEFRKGLYVHTMPVPAEMWRNWASSEGFGRGIEARMRELGVGAERRKALKARADQYEGWESLSQLDGAARMVAALVKSGAVKAGGEAERLLERLAEKGAKVPDAYRTARRNAASEENVTLSGAVLITVAGRKAEAGGERKISPELAAALKPEKGQAGAQLWRLLKEDGLFGPAVLLPAIALSAGAVALEALLLRGVFEVSKELAVGWQRLGATAALLAFVVGLLLMEWPLATSLLRLGRKLEARLRVAFLAKVPRLGDRYFQSRLVSDMAARSHSVHMVRVLPELAGQLLRAGFEMLFTVAAIAWLYPGSLWGAVGVAALAVAIPLAAQPVLAARDLKWRTHAGALSRYYLDAMLGLVAVRAHGAERALRREQEAMLAEWAWSGMESQKAAVLLDGIQFLVTLGLAAWLLLSQMAPGSEPAGVLLLAFWALNLPMLGQEIGAVARQYPGQRNVTLRLMEPLGAPEEVVPEVEAEARSGGVQIELDGVTVRAAGHLILEQVELSVKPGEQIGIVGSSGAGKSSLVGLLLGWHRVAEGSLRVDGMELDAAGLAALRRVTAWIDPQVHLWNRPLLENLQYGSPLGAEMNLERALERADLRGVLRKLPDGLQTVLGEGGALVSGGEGQRVRIGRAMMKPGVRLAILDEPARGLDRGKRRALIAKVREAWPEATLLCITHDVGDTLEFERVLVVEKGKIAEDGHPKVLAKAEGSRYRALLEAEEAVLHGMWQSATWRRLRLEGGKVKEGGQ
ncbi:MAG: ATP-binding cassette domain-containing protein [Acidobacteria bacterium]|nr:ATP-binding cassette domain-containing protein [Acidobacteriota bacterium]